MRKIIFLSIMLSSIAVNAQNPISIRTYIPAPDSFSMQRDFTYDEHNNLIQEVITDYQEGMVTVVKREYDPNNRIVFLAAFNENEDTVRKEIWSYDASSKVIKHTIYRRSEGVLSPVERTTFTGVNDMNEPEGEIGIEILGYKISMKYRNCTSVTTEALSNGILTLPLTSTPNYVNGRISSLSIIPNFDFGLPISFTMSANFTYNMQNKLSRVGLNLIASEFPIPIPIASIENSYENNLLVDSVTRTNLALIASMIGLPAISDVAFWQSFTYNNDKTIATISHLVDGNNSGTWTLVSRDWYDYLFYFTSINESICQGDSYNFFGKLLTTTDIYYDTLQTVNGCDSIFELTLTVHPVYFTPIHESICQGDSYNFFGKLLTTADIYYDTLRTVNGCDSVFELTLTVNPVNVPIYVKNKLNLFPNPAKDKIQIITENEPVSTVTIHDLVGKEVLHIDNIADYKTDIAIQNLNSGVYVLKIKTTNDLLIQKFVKQ